MSLEDKAKEYANSEWPESQDASTGGYFAGCELRDDAASSFVDGYKQAIQDLMERASESPLEFSTTYTGWMDQTDGSRAAYISGETDKRKVIFLKDLEQAAEDLIKENK